MKLSLFTFAFASLLLVGCQDGAWFRYETKPPSSVAVVNDGSIQVSAGAAVVVVPYFVHEEIEGSSLHAPDEVRSEDPTIASVTTTTHIYELEPGENQRGISVVGLRAGDTHLQLIRGGDVDGTILVHVTAAAP